MPIEYRPWGPFAWVAAKLNVQEWALVGTNSPEHRCTALLQHYRALFGRCRFLEIRDPDPDEPDALANSLQERAAELGALGIQGEELQRVPLMASLDEMRAIIACFLDGSAPNIILDISAMPKRWFFPLVRFFQLDDQIRNIVVTYATADRYGQHLAENPEPVLVIPSYHTDDGREQHDNLIIGIGFEPLGLASLVGEISAEKVRLLFPFPPGPPGFSRNWLFVKQLEDMTEEQEFDPDQMHIHMYDCPQVFDAICSLTNGGNQTCALAPYGPKPMSLAMALYSLAVAAAGKPMAPVYYAQPSRYAIDYSSGVRTLDGVPEIQAFCIKREGNPIYRLAGAR